MLNLESALATLNGHSCRVSCGKFRKKTFLFFALKKISSTRMKRSHVLYVGVTRDVLGGLFYFDITFLVCLRFLTDTNQFSGWKTQGINIKIFNKNLTHTFSRRKITWIKFSEELVSLWDQRVFVACFLTDREFQNGLPLSRRLPESWLFLKALIFL